MTWWAGIVVRLYPRAFRRRYGAEILAAIETDRARVPRDERARFAFDTARDLAVSVMRERSRQAARTVARVTGGGAPHLPAPARSSVMDTILQDIRYAARQFASRPGFAAVAVLSLALGIGANTLIFGIVDGLVLRPFPYPDPDRLVSIGVSFPRVSSETNYVEVLSPAEYADIRSSRSFAHLGAFDLGNRNISGGDLPERVFTALLLEDLFPVLGMTPVLGRGFTDEEIAPNGPRVAIISHRLWQSRFGGDPNILSRPVRVGGEAASVVGVMPPGLLLIGTDLWIPWNGDAARMPRNRRQFTILGRLAPGASLAQANAELATLAARTDAAERARFKEYEGWRLVATPWAAALMQDVRPAAFILLGAVALVLVIACANLANLFLARATTRQRELAVRLALGAGRWRIARQLLTESGLLAVAGAAAGLLITYAGLQGAASIVPAQFRSLGLEARLNTRVLAWTVVLTIASTLLVALIPVLHAWRADPHDSLKAEGRTGGAPRARRARQFLVIAEIALSVVLLFGASLLIRSFARLQQVEPGFNPRGVLTMRLTLPRERYPTSETQTAFFERLVEDVQALPSVTAAAMSSQFPPQGPFSSQIEVDGAVSQGSQLPTANTTIVSRGYFTTLGIPIVAGRAFDGRDRPGGHRVVVVNQAFAARYLAGRDAVGGRVRMAGSGDRPPGPWAEIVGVAADARNRGMAAPIQPEIYSAMERGVDGWNQLFLIVRSNGPADAMIAPVRDAVRALDRDQPVYAIQTLEEAIALSTFQQRLTARLLSIFAAAALLLAAVGVYGVLSYFVTARTQEMGVRLAIGAQPRDVLWLVVRQVLWLAAAGVAIGIGLAIPASRALRDLLYGVQPSDPLTIALVCAALSGVALLAAWVPARRASRTDPLAALRYE